MGKNADGTKAADMETGDFSKKQITDINWLFNIQINEDSDTLYDEFSGMSTDLFATGEMEKVVLAMINHTKDGTGADYSNQTLTQKAKEHKITLMEFDIPFNGRIYTWEQG